MKRIFQNNKLGMWESGDWRILSEQDEEYLQDDRVNLRPSEIVQSKLMNILPKGAPVPVSCHHFRREIRR